jgi:hypothetical protein
LILPFFGFNAQVNNRALVKPELRLFGSPDPCFVGVVAVGASMWALLRAHTPDSQFATLEEHGVRHKYIVKELCRDYSTLDPPSQGEEDVSLRMPVGVHFWMVPVMISPLKGLKTIIRNWTEFQMSAVLIVEMTQYTIDVCIACPIAYQAIRGFQEIIHANAEADFLHNLARS